MNRAQFYADGLRWIGSLFDAAAAYFEGSARRIVESDPRWRVQVEECLHKVRARAHLLG